MTEIIKRLPNGFIITSEKIERCDPEWAVPVFSLGFSWGILVISLTVLLHDWIFLPLIFLSVSIIMLPFFFQKCGVKIQLTYGKEFSHSDTLQLSNNPEEDAIRINKIIEGYINLSNSETIRRNLKPSKNVQCQVQYDEVIKMVKKNE